MFVSHNLDAIQRLCSRAILLERGRVAADGAPADVVSAYMERTLPDQATGNSRGPDDAPRIGTGEARLREVALTTTDWRPLGALHLNQRFRIVATFEVDEEVGDAVVEFGISTFGGDRIATVQSIDREGPLLRFARGRRSIWAELDTSMLPGEFALDVALHHRSGVTVDHVQDALRFTALNAAEQGSDHYPWSVVRGYVRPSSNWSGVRRPQAWAPPPTEGAGVTGITARGRAHAVGLAGMVARALPRRTRAGDDPPPIQRARGVEGTPVDSYWGRAHGPRSRLPQSPHSPQPRVALLRVSVVPRAHRALG